MDFILSNVAAKSRSRLKGCQLGILLLTLAGFLSAVVSVGSAQTPTGMPPFASVSSGPDAINPSNLNIHFGLSLMSKPGRGLGFEQLLTYDNSLWFRVTQNGTTSWQSGFGTWAWRPHVLVRDDGTGAGYLFFNASAAPQGCTIDVEGDKGFVLSNWVFYDGNGTSHPIPQGSINQCNNTDGFDVLTTDGSGYRLVIQYTKTSLTSETYSINVYSRSGDAIHFPALNLNNLDSGQVFADQVTDSNGNFISNNGSGWKDTLGMLPITGGGTEWDYAVVNSSINSGKVKVDWLDYAVQSNFQCPGINEQPQTTTSLISAIHLNDGTSYYFQYEPVPGATNPFYPVVTGRLSSIQLPTGGKISYTYPGPNSGINCSDGSTMQLTRTTSDGQTTYTRTVNGAASTTTIENPEHAITTINYQASGVNLYETKRTVGLSNGTVFETVNTCYNGAQGDCTNVAVTLPISQVSKTTVLEDGSTQNRVDMQYNSVGLTTESDEYDYGRGSAGPLLRKTVRAYAPLGNHISDRVASITVQDGSGTQTAFTAFSYDEVAPDATGLDMQHNPVTGSRGNLTSLSNWISTDGSTAKTTFEHDDTGNVRSIVDPVGQSDPANHTTSINYEFSGQQAYVTDIYLPTTSRSHSYQMRWDDNTGLPTMAIDQNGNATQYFYDNNLRLTNIQNPDGGVQTITYTSPSQIDVQQTMDASGQALHKTIYLDAYGRESRIDVSDPEGMVSIDKTYDAMGRLWKVSNPHRSMAAGTDGTRQYSYDYLDRFTGTTEPDGGSISYTYAGNTVLFQDQQGHKRQSIVDGLGRISEIVEPNPTTGSMTSGQLLTDITYVQSPTGTVVTSTQRGDGTQNARIRTFSYDSLSRLTSRNTPEARQTNYYYDLNNNLHYIVDARGVQTTITYDSLNRPITKTYSDGTPSVTFNYDEASPFGFDGAANTVGRLSSTSIGNGLAGSMYAYDVMGRLIRNDQCVGTNCGGAAYVVSATYDYLGNVTSLLYPSGRKIVNSYNTAGRLTGITYDSYGGTAINYPYYTVPQSSASSGGWGYTPAGNLQNATLGPGFSQNIQTSNTGHVVVIGATALSQTVLSKTISYAPAGLHDDGNVSLAFDNLNQNRNQNFQYDNLNRLISAATTATSGPEAWNESFSYDAWGNLKQSGNWSFNPTFDASNHIVQTGYNYDAAGNLLTDTLHTYTYDAAERMSTVDGTSAYTYGGEGQRVRKTSAGQNTDYIYFGDRVIAERDNDGNWSDYIFAGGERVAKAEGLNRDLHFFGTTQGTSQYAFGYLGGGAGLNGYQINSGDKLYLTQYQESGSKGGMVLAFTDGSNSGWTVTDQDGNFLNDDQQQDTTHVRTVDLSALAGKIISSVAVNDESDTAPGAWNIYFDQVALVSADGTVHPIYTGETYSPIGSIAATSGETGVGATIDTNQEKAIYPEDTTTYYASDQVGSSRLIVSGNGYPVWSGVFLPYGQQVSSTISTNTYNFAGTEDDPESGLNHAMYRQYGTTQGRWLSPDPYIGSMRIDNPQTLNSYAYVAGNPASASDREGLDGCIGFDCWITFTGGGGSAGGGSFGGPFTNGPSVGTGPGPGLWNLGLPPGVVTGNPGQSYAPPVQSGPASVTPVQPSVQLADTEMGVWGEAIFHGPGMHNLWAQSSNVANLAAGATAGVVLGVPAVGELFGSLAALPQMDVVVGAGKPFHVAYGVGGTWLEATGDFFDMTVEDASVYERYVRMNGGLRFSLPVLYPDAVLGTAGATASTCLTGACSAFFKGWGF